jgi:hypothetical protein
VSIRLRRGGIGMARSEALCLRASSSVSIGGALVRGDEVGLSATRYVVAKMLSLSDSCGRSTDDFHRLLSCVRGAVLERPVCARVFGVTAPRSAACCEAPWLGCSGGVCALTDAGGEAFPWVSGWFDMGSTLVRPSRRRACESVAGVADNTGWAPGTCVGRGGKSQRRDPAVEAAGGQERVSAGSE